jgi:hypothetical protein
VKKLEILMSSKKGPTRDSSTDADKKNSFYFTKFKASAFVLWNLGPVYMQKNFIKFFKILRHIESLIHETLNIDKK